MYSFTDKLAVGTLGLLIAGECFTTVANTNQSPPADTNRSVGCWIDNVPHFIADGLV